MFFHKKSVTHYRIYNVKYNTLDFTESYKINFNILDISVDKVNIIYYNACG